MNKFILLFSIFCATTLANKDISAQTNPSQKCGFDRMIDYQDLLFTGYKENVSATYRSFLDRANNRQNISSKTTLVIPVVFHVVWNTSTPTQNIDDSVLIEQIAVLNEDFSRSNTDAANTRSEFLPIVSNAAIQFKLACFDPHGDPTDGIVRVQTTELFGDLTFQNFSLITNIQRTANGGSDAWNTSEYLNIWVGDINRGIASPALLGIATPPVGLSNWPVNSIPPEFNDGVIVQFNAFGRNNPNPIAGMVVNGRVVTHEVGHYLGTRHCAENTYNGANGSICTDDDGVIDTPTCDQSAQDCDMNRNSCLDVIPGTTNDLHDMVENYMDYSNQECQNSFTVGQTTIMRNVLQNERASLLTSPGISNCGTNSIHEKGGNSEFTIYPNPSNGGFTINTPNNSIVTVKNSLGQIITPSITTKGNKTALKIETKGIYFVKIESNDHTVTQKVIVQ